jgi:hypothetical protein
MPDSNNLEMIGLIEMPQKSVVVAWSAELHLGIGKV